MAGSLFKRSLALLSAAVLAASLVFAAVGLSVLGAAYSKANESSLARAASALAAEYRLSESATAPAPAAAFARAAAAGGYRVTLIAPDGLVLADSEADPAAMENHSSRPEVAAALAGRASSARRMSATVGVELLYAAAPLPSGGALRLALSEPGLDRALAPARWALSLAALAFAAAVIAAAAAFSRMTARPLASLAAAARAYGSGEAAPAEATRSIRGEDPEEIRLLAGTLDSMAAEIGKRMLAAKAQGAELEAILDAIAEAVLALDGKLRISLANPAAAALFGLGGSGLRSGGSLLESTRSSELQAVAADCLASGEARRAEVILFLPAERCFQVMAAPLGQGSGGVVIVLGDITELRRLERVRKDFVANVSHELRTPVQLIKGYAEYLGAEALGDGAIGDPEQAKRFVGIIGRNASRMESLIADLLSLASLEREGREWLEAERAEIAPILASARESIAPKAEARGAAILVECEAGLAARVDAGLLEQAVANLLDNAVKYSPPATTVRATARSEEGELVIEVRDQGIGIPAKDLPRVFERFYRVDKARSREFGGTGLGLAIVRHIAMAHRGAVSVESWEGEGSTFRIRMPL